MLKLKLAKTLSNRKTHLVGTLRRNRKELPKEVVSVKLKKGDIKGAEKNGIVVFKWRDKRDVLMLTTKHSLEMIEVPGKNGAKIKPKAIAEYNYAKAFIDLSDQMSWYSNSLRRSVKWFRKLAIEIIIWEIVVNANYFWNKNESNKKNITKFREELCEQLLKKGKIEQGDPEDVTGLNHKYEDMGKKGRCTRCYQKNKEEKGREYTLKKSTQCKSGCVTCSKPLICIKCFFETHNVLEK